MPLTFLLALALAPQEPLLGVHVGNDVELPQYEAFGDWLGRRVMARVTFCANEKWSDVAHPYHFDATERWIKSYPGRIEVVSVPLLPNEEKARFTAQNRSSEADRLAAGRSGKGQFDSVARGDHDADFRSLATDLQRRGIADRTIIRLGWEYNGNWFAWSLGKDPEGYRKAFRRAAFAMRKAAPKLRFDLGMANRGEYDADWRDAYPGDDVVDVISVDIYDHYNNGWDDQLLGKAGLKEYREFVRRHNKLEAYSEWGLSTDTHGHGDDPAFVDHLADWFAAAPKRVLYQAVWNTWAGGPNAALQGERSGLVPLSAAAYKRRFGAKSAKPLAE
ncbi:hypothetical protein BH11ARM2_BH11ARM2_07370 [soil metagenome]